MTGLDFYDDSLTFEWWRTDIFTMTVKIAIMTSRDFQDQDLKINFGDVGASMIHGWDDLNHWEELVP